MATVQIYGYYAYLYLQGTQLLQNIGPNISYSISTFLTVMYGLQPNCYTLHRDYLFYSTVYLKPCCETNVHEILYAISM